MLDEQAQQEANRTYMLVLMIWGSMIFSVLMYVAISFVLTQNKKPVENSSIPMMRNIFMALSFSGAGAAYFIKQALLKRITSRPGAANAVALAAQYQTAGIVTFALSEACAVYGFVLVFLSNSMKEIFPFTGISLFCFMIFFPRKAELETLLMENLRLPKRKY